jgi:hypothetical protein
VLLETGVGAPASIPSPQPRVAIVPVEQMLAAAVGGAADALQEGRKLGVGDRTPVKPE